MSENSKEKWEIEYQNFKTKNLDEEIAKLKQEIDNSNNITAPNRSELREKTLDKGKKQKQIQKLEMIKINMPKIERILKFKDAQIIRFEKLMEEKKNLEQILNKNYIYSGIYKEEIRKLEKEFESLNLKRTEIQRKLKDSKISEGERINLRKQLEENLKAQNENQGNYSENQLKLTEILNKPIIKKDFDKEIQSAKNMISKCNFIGSHLIEGKSIEEIGVDLSSWKPLNKKNESEIKREEELIEVSKFDKKYPRLAKVKNFFKNIWKNKTKKEDNREEKKAEGQQNNGKLSKEEIAAKKAELYKRIAETGRVSGEKRNKDKTNYSKSEDNTTQEKEQSEEKNKIHVVVRKVKVKPKDAVDVQKNAQNGYNNEKGEGR